jgi:hypothetical protein
MHSHRTELIGALLGLYKLCELTHRTIDDQRRPRILPLPGRVVDLIPTERQVADSEFHAYPFNLATKPRASSNRDVETIQAPQNPRGPKMHPPTKLTVKLVYARRHDPLPSLPRYRPRQLWVYLAQGLPKGKREVGFVRPLPNAVRQQAPQCLPVDELTDIAAKAQLLGRRESELNKAMIPHR